MGKIIKYIVIIVVLMAAFFGAGLGLAELKIRYFSPQKTIIVPKNSSDVAAEAEKAESEASPVSEVTEQLAEEAEKTENLKGSTEPDGQSFSFAILGDSQYFNPGNPNGALQKAVRNIKSSNPDLVFAVGDLISSCDNVGECVPKFAQWKKATAPFSGKIYAMQGNHDRTGKDKADEAWNALFNFPKNGPAGFQNMTYSFDRGNSHFVVLDSDKPKENIINDVQRNWLEQDLARNKKTNTFVFFHEPAWPVGAKIGESLDVEGKDRNALWEILVRRRVTAVFSGHEHIYSRKQVNGLYQFVVGNTDSFDHQNANPGAAEYSYVGPHYAIVTVSGKKITVKAYSVDGKLVNSFDFQR